METTCAICHTPIVSTPGFKPRLYCGTVCKSAAFRRRQEGYKPSATKVRTCAICGTDIDGPVTQGYCSLVCQRQAHSVGDRFCDTCDRPLVAESNKRFCCGTCQHYMSLWRKDTGQNNESIPGVCVICGAAFVGRVDKKYCSRACLGKAFVEYNRKRHREVYSKDPEFMQRKREYTNATRRQWRIDAFNAYGGQRCVCCGETHYEFLSIDHINGGGNKHRKERGVEDLARWLYKNNFPAGFRVLCHNCNQAAGYYGRCPHELEREQEGQTEPQPAGKEQYRE